MDGKFVARIAKAKTPSLWSVMFLPLANPQNRSLVLMRRETLNLVATLTHYPSPRCAPLHVFIYGNAVFQAGNLQVLRRSMTGKANEHRLRLELHSPYIQDLSLYFVPERDDVGSCGAAAVHNRQRVFAGDAHASAAITSVKAGLLHQPGRRQLHHAIFRGITGNNLAGNARSGQGLHAIGFGRRKDGVLEE